MALDYLILNIIIWFSIYMIIVLSLNIEYGYAGIPNFGRAMAVLIGAIAVGGIVNRVLIYILNIDGGIIQSTGILKSTLNSMISQNPFLGLAILIFSLLVAGLIGALAGGLFIIPSVKLRNDYLAITLLAISEVLYLISNYNRSIIGGYYGVNTPDVLAWVPGEHRLFAFAILGLIIVLFVYLFTERLLTSPFGRLLKAMRENEDVIKSFGRNPFKLKVKAVAIGSGVAAMAGAFYSLLSSNVIASTFFRVEWTFFPFLMLLLGGSGNNKGVILGVLSFVVAKVLLIVYKFEIKDILNLPFEATWLEYILFGSIMLLILYYKPHGLIKEKPVFTPALKNLKKTHQKI
mgnify:CR=1 FL=1